MKGLRIALAVVIAAAGVIGVQVAFGADRRGDDRATSATSVRQLARVNFVSNCRFSHRNTDDLIVFPGQPGVSHDHTYVGNVSTNAHSTLRSLRRADTTCRRDGHTAAYWVPTLLDASGRAVEPLGATIYYRRRTLAPVTAFPAGLRVIAGDATATSPQRRRVTFWNCGVRAGVPASSEIPTCPPGRRTMLRLHVTFPNCWNGRDLDSADHKSHMAYARRGVCPASHPVEVPSISLILRYPVSGGHGYELASGGQYSAHADFVNAWNQRELTRLVEGCLNALRHCGRGS